ncbi:MAG: hypothetical protein K9M82_11140 [Deltaproteobacteria bacterium]|nr:hypothetical protein [Deltaproteobacteria bacterium]
MSRKTKAEIERLVTRIDMQRALLALDIARLERRKSAVDAGLLLADLVLTLRALFSPSGRRPQ